MVEYMEDHPEWVTHSWSNTRYYQRGGIVVAVDLKASQMVELLAEISVADFPLLLLCAGRLLEPATLNFGCENIYVLPIEPQWESTRKELDARRMSYDQAKEYISSSD